MVRRTGRAVHDRADASWLFHGRPVKILDGSTVIMPDTPRNQAAYPQPRGQAPGLGFPIARILVVFSLAVGTVLEAAIGPYQGKQTSELALLRTVIDQFRPGDIVLADRFFCSYWVIAALQARGVDVVMRLHQRRTADFRCGHRLGRDDHVVLWKKPEQVPDWMSRAEYEAMPPWLAIREVRVRVTDKTKRVRRLVIATTLTDARDLPGRASWGAVPAAVARGAGPAVAQDGYAHGDARTRSPEMVRKEMAAHLLAYNLIRGVMAEAARGEGIEPRRLSFKGAVHTVREFEASHLYDPERIERDLPLLVSLIGQEAGGRSTGSVRAAGGETATEAAPAPADDPHEGQGLDQTGFIPL